MSDDIRFEDVSYREPHRLRRPDRDRAFACLDYGTPGPDDLAIFLDRRTADAIERHALSDTTVELGGILLGKECVDEETGEPFVLVVEAIEARHYQNTQASFTYTHDSWGEITRERDQKHPDLEIVGWYHTHPNFGIFLSGHDVFIQQHFFGQPLQVAYVVDPIRQTRGFFQWTNDGLRQVEGYAIVAPRDQRMALARSVNDLEGLPNTEGGGGSGALSPRLEAELIAMLNRPHSTATTADRGQTAAVFSLLGMVLGVLGVALALWIASLTGQVREQSEALRGLRADLAKLAEGQATKESSQRVRAKEQALDALLGEVRLGDSNERFMEVYNRVREERDEAIEDATVYKQIRADLIAKDREIKVLQKARELDDRRLERLDEVLARADRLKRDNSLLLTEAEKVPELQAAIKTYEDVKVGRLPRNYAIAWYAAIVGWVSAVLLGLGLVAVVARRPPLEEEADRPDPSSIRTGQGQAPESPHRID